MVACLKCRTENREGAKVCVNCMVPFPAAPTPPPASLTKKELKAEQKLTKEIRARVAKVQRLLKRRKIGPNEALLEMGKVKQTYFQRSARPTLPEAFFEIAGMKYAQTPPDAHSGAAVLNEKITFSEARPELDDG